jgi:peptidoglycan/xylan/chitin deacetylase (PgdA/CDA1 family)
MYPGTGFEPKPAYIPNDVIIPTLDDGPQGVKTSMAKMPGYWTNEDLKYLDANNMHWDFFVNVNNECDLTVASPESQCVAAIKDILALHNPANHTVHHWDLAIDSLGCGDTTCVDSEMAGVETVINQLSNGDRPHLTRFRAPFGDPYVTGTYVAWVQPVVRKYAVSVGWNVDSYDSDWDDGTNCTVLNGGAPGPCPTGQIVAKAVTDQIGTPGNGMAYGILLMHAVFGWSHDAIKILFDPSTGYVPMNHFRIGTVEDAICWKYGMHSWEIVQKLNVQSRAPN